MKKARPVLIVIFALLAAVSIIMIATELFRQKDDIDNFKELAELVSENTLPDSPDNPMQPTEKDLPVDVAPPTVRNLTPLFARNSDCIGWLSIADTKVDYPIMHTPADPEKYLHTNFDGGYSASGVPFIDAGCEMPCDHTVIYGHNMKNGTMFADITKYRDKAYFESHPTVEFQTSQGVQSFSVFAVIRVKSNDNWYYTHTFADETAFSQAITSLKERALYDTGVDPLYGNQLLTLSTCYGAEKNDRIIVVCAEITEN